MLGKDPGRFYPGISVRIGRFVNDDADLRFHDVFEGNIVNLLEEVIKQLGYKYLVKQIEFRGILRIEKGEYPLEALREMLLNALVHRTYMGVHIQIRVYNDKIMIWNEGGLPYNMDIEMLKRVHTSYPRNQLIANACFKAGYIDTWGRGTLKIINSCKKAGLPTPEIIETAGGIQVTLFKNADDGDTTQDIGSQTGGRTGGRTGGQVVSLTDKQKEVFRYIVEEPTISRSKLVKKMGINPSAVQKHIEALKKKGYIERDGETIGSWKIKFQKK